MTLPTRTLAWRRKTRWSRIFWSFVSKRKLALAQQTSQQPMTIMHRWCGSTMRHVVVSSYYFAVNPLQISALSERTGAAAIAFFSHSNLEDTFEPNWICFPYAETSLKRQWTMGCGTFPSSWNNGHAQRRKVATPSIRSQLCKRSVARSSTALSVSIS